MLCEDPSYASGQTRTPYWNRRCPRSWNDRHLTRVAPSRRSDCTAATGRSQPRYLGRRAGAVRALGRIRPPERHADRLPSQAPPGCHRGAPARDGCQPAHLFVPEQPSTSRGCTGRSRTVARYGHHLGVDASDIALTDSTTMGVSLIYNGLRLTPDQEILTTEQDYYVTHEAIRLPRSGRARGFARSRSTTVLSGSRRSRSLSGSDRALRLPPASWRSPGCTRAPG